MHVPAANVVIHRHPGVPRGNLIERAVPSHPREAVLRNGPPPRNLDRRDAAGRQWRGQIDSGDRAVHVVAEWGATHGHLLEGHAPAALAREVEHRVAEQQRRHAEHGGLAPRIAQIRVQLEPKERERVRRAVVIPNGLRTGQQVLVRRESCPDRIVDLLLPIIGARPTGGRAQRVGRRETERPERRLGPAL